MGVRVLLIEDDDTIAEPLAEGLGHFGLTVDRVSTGAAGLRGPYGDVVLLDLGLPDMDGIDVCRGIRQYSDVPVIILSARGEEADRVLGLELGADDYLAKPFSLRELVARIRAVTRRTQQGRGRQPGLGEGEFGATPPAGTPVVGPLGTGPLGGGTLGAGVRVTGLLGDGPPAGMPPGAGTLGAGAYDPASSDVGPSDPRSRSAGAYASGSGGGSSAPRPHAAEAYEPGSPSAESSGVRSSFAGVYKPEDPDAEPSGERRSAVGPRHEQPFRGEPFGGEPFAGEAFAEGPDNAGRDTAGRGVAGPDAASRGGAGSDGAGADGTSSARSSYGPSDGTRTRPSYDPSGTTEAPTSYDAAEATRASDPYDYGSSRGGRGRSSYDPSGTAGAPASSDAFRATRASDPYEPSGGPRRFEEPSRSFEFGSDDANRPLGAGDSFGSGPAFEFAPSVPAGQPRREPSAAPGGGTPSLDADAESAPEAPPTPGPLVVDRRTRQVWVGDSPVSLTPKEFELLALLTEDPGAVYSRQQILDRVWDPHYQGPTKTLDVHVATLRRKLGNSAWIQTLRGVGFRLAVQNRPPSKGGSAAGTGGGPAGGSYGEQPGRPDGAYRSYESLGAYEDFPDGGSYEARPTAFR